MGKGSGSGSGAIVRQAAAPPVSTIAAQHHKSPERQRRMPSLHSSNGPKGLQNIGNSCYANAALHCLLSTALTNALLDPTAATIFRRYSSNPNILLQGSGSVDSEDSSASGKRKKCSREKQRRKDREDQKMQENCQWLTRELRRLTREYHKDQKSSGSWFSSYSSNSTTVVDPGYITKHPNRLSKCLTPFQQEDAHEFLRALLSTLVMNGHNKHLSSLFDGLLESSVTCTGCNRPSLTRDRYMDLSLDISDPSTDTLTDALCEFTRTETLTGDNKVHCQKCGCKRIATKGLRLATAPSILVCHLKRFAYDEYGNLVRLRKKVRFPERLEIGSFMSRVNKARPPPYDLVSVLVHQGQSCDSGHYLSYVKNNGEWFQCNDSVIKKVDVETVMQQQAYILMYEVAEMRESTAFQSPSRSLKSKSSLREETSARNPGLSYFSSMLCGLDESLLADYCCNPAAPKRANTVDEEDMPSFENRLPRYEQSSHDDLSTLGESTVASTDSNVRPIMHRSVSSGKLLDKEYMRQVNESRTSTKRQELRSSERSPLPTKDASLKQQPRLHRGSSSGQIVEGSEMLAKLRSYGSCSDPGGNNEEATPTATRKWKSGRRINRPVDRESSLPRHETYRRPPPSPKRRPDP